MRFLKEQKKLSGRTFHVLSDGATGASAWILSSFGANCMQLLLSPGDGRPAVAVIDDIAHVDNLSETPSRYGIPILFPWASDLARGGFHFEGKDYQYNRPGEETRRFHGFVHTANWEMTDCGADENGAWVTCAVESGRCGELARNFPSASRLTVTWHLGPQGMEMKMKVENIGDERMPFGLGLHPYFHLPVTDDDGTPAECAIRAQVGRQWDLSAIRHVRVPDVAPDNPFFSGHSDADFGEERVPVSDLTLDHVFEARHEENGGGTSASFINGSTGVTLKLTASGGFDTWVLYTPPNRAAVSLEPWTMIPNGFNLMAAGLKNTGVITLEPNDEWTGRVKFSLDRTM